jgi:hypothetical protein
MQAIASVLDMNKFSSIHFNLTLSDIDQPWFHRNASRDDAMERLKDQDIGTFLIRPSSHPGCYAMSWVDENTQIRHNLIYNKFPGFTLNVNGNGEDHIYASLTQLVQQSSFLAKYIPNTENTNKNLTSSSGELVSKIIEKTTQNDEAFKSLTWALTILEGPDTYSKPEKCERRTYIRCCEEEYVAPDLVKFDRFLAKAIFKQLRHNTNMTSLVLKGHEGFMRVNFTPNIGDEEMKYLCKCLRWNNTITHLDLSSNNISDEGAKELAAVLRENRQSRLRRINLKQNFIRSGGLAALAESLSTNKNIEVLELGNQFVINTVSKAVTLSSDRYEKLLVSLIEDTLDRKREILSDCNYFHRYLQPLEAEEKVRKQNAVGSFLFYIKQSAPGIIFVCYSTLDDRKQVQYVHKEIFRTNCGYSFIRHDSTISVHSLFDTCAWYMCALPDLKFYKDNFPGDIEMKIGEMQDLSVLWAIRDVPNKTVVDPIAFRKGSYPTLNYLVQRNINSLRHPVLRPSQNNLDSSGDSSVNNVNKSLRNYSL